MINIVHSDRKRRRRKLSGKQSNSNMGFSTSHLTIFHVVVIIIVVALQLHSSFAFQSPLQQVISAKFAITKSPMKYPLRNHGYSLTRIKSTTQDEELANNNSSNTNNNTNNSTNNNTNSNTNSNTNKRQRGSNHPIIRHFDKASKLNESRSAMNILKPTGSKLRKECTMEDDTEEMYQVKEPLRQNIGPNHIAFICDGNSRWSKRKKTSSSNNNNNISSDDQQNFEINKNDQNKSYSQSFWGHSKGASNVINLIKHIQQNHPSSINYVTMYAFSTENWSRGEKEIKDLWNVIETFSTRFYDWALRYNVRVKIIGDLNDDRIPSSLRDKLMKLEIDTYCAFQRYNAGSRNSIDSDNSGLTLSIAINYGGRKDIINASLKLAELISRGEIILSDDNESNDDVETIFTNLLSTSSIPDPDLIIRTGGEQRLSNFLIWNCAYSELYFSNVLWPDFDEKELDNAIEWYCSRERRFGGRKQ